jgi:hypothetical protein
MSFSEHQLPCTLGPAGVPTMPGEPPVPVGVFWGLLVGLVFAARPSFNLDGMRSDCPLVAPGSLAAAFPPLMGLESSDAAKAPVAMERAATTTPYLITFI